MWSRGDRMTVIGLLFSVAVALAAALASFNEVQWRSKALDARQDKAEARQDATDARVDAIERDKSTARELEQLRLQLRDVAKDVEAIRDRLPPRRR